MRVASYTGTACGVEAAVDPVTGQAVERPVSRPLATAPPWMRRRCCARFGWGGKLVTARPPVGKDATRAVVISHVSSEPELAVHSARFEEAMGGDLRDYCGAKAEQEDRAEAEYWEFIQVRLPPSRCGVCTRRGALYNILSGRAALTHASLRALGGGRRVDVHSPCGT